MRFTHTIETVVDVESRQAKDQWRIGDALKNDLAGADSALEGGISRSIFSECAELLAAKGFHDYDPAHLAKLYRTALAFPRQHRDPAISWGAHYEAGTPENLTNAARALRRLNKTVTQPNVGWLMQLQREKEAKRREAANEKAKADRDKAAKEQAEAAKRKLAAKTKIEKDAAEKVRQQKKAEREAASKVVEETRSAPKFNENIEIEQGDDALKIAAIYLGITVHAKEIEKHAKLMIVEVDKISESMTPAQAKDTIDHSQRVIDLMKDLREHLGAGSKQRFKVHQGGAA